MAQAGRGKCWSGIISQSAIVGESQFENHAFDFESFSLRYGASLPHPERRSDQSQSVRIRCQIFEYRLLPPGFLSYYALLYGKELTGIYLTAVPFEKLKR